MTGRCWCISDSVESGKYNLIYFTATQVHVLLCPCIAFLVALLFYLCYLFMAVSCCS